jgi:hypothetical protein
MSLHPYMTEQMVATRREDALAIAERATLARATHWGVHRVARHRGVRRVAAPFVRWAGLRARRRVAVPTHDGLAGCGCG